LTNPVNVTYQVAGDNQSVFINWSYTNFTVKSDGTFVDSNTPTVLNETGFKIERSTDKSNWTILNNGNPVPAGSNSYQDKTVQNGTYYYRVTAINAYGSSSSVIAVKPNRGVQSDSPAKLLAPANISFTVAAAGGGHFAIYWPDTHDINPLVTDYSIQRSDFGINNWQIVQDYPMPVFATADTDDNSYNSVRAAVSDFGTITGNKYSYRLVTTNANTSTVSAIQTVTA